MFNEPLDLLPLWVLFLATPLLLLSTLEAGYRYGVWRHMNQPDEKEQPVVAIVAAILGLVALVLGFTFNLAASRFEARRQVVLEEANAIGTTYLRARILPEENRSNAEKLLREYVEVRLSAVEPGKLEAAIQRSEELHRLLWTEADAAAEANSSSIMTGLFIQSLNDVIDLHAKRMLVGLRSRIPLVIWIGLFGLAILGMIAVGYECGLSETRRTPAMLGLVFAFSVVLMMILDLDRGHEGLLRVGQQAMSVLQKSIQSPER
jgi:hypothetical protein